MGKPKYQQHYRKEWENIYKWLTPVTSDPARAFCTYCKTQIYAKLTDIKKHANTKKHKVKSNPFINKQQTKIPFKKGLNKSTSLTEATLSLFIAEHCSILSADHLSELCKKQFSDSKATANLRMHRTKCTQIICNVLAPHFIENLRTDVGDKAFSIIIDESTDISVIKVLGVIIRYFSISLKRVVSRFLGLLELPDGSAQAMVEQIKILLQNLQIDPTKMIGVGVDNASVN